MGPLLFLIYINDLPDSISFANVYLFADDAKLVKSILSFNDSAVMQKDLDALQAWCIEWKLKLNTKKCSAISFGRSDSDHFPYAIGDTPIDSVSSHRDLGVVCYSSFSWSKHYDKICKAAFGSLHLIRRNISVSQSIPVKRLLYITLVRSHFVYGSQLWRPLLIKDISRLERVQRKATKFILSDSTSSYKERLINLNLLPLMMWFELQDMLFLIKNIKYPSDNYNILDFVSFVKSSTRFGSSTKLKLNLCRTNTTRHFYFNRIARLWNSFPEIDLSLSVRTIKSRLYNHLWNYFTAKFDSHSICTFHLSCPHCKLYNGL